MGGLQVSMAVSDILTVNLGVRIMGLIFCASRFAGYSYDFGNRHTG